MCDKRRDTTVRFLCYLTCLSFFASSAEAKFSHVYHGIAEQGLEACLADPRYSFTAANISLRENARDGFDCIMDNIPNSQQAILSSGSSILGMIPTALSFLGHRKSDIMAVHTKLPILAFLLTMTGISVDKRVCRTRDYNVVKPKLPRRKLSSALLFDVDKVETRIERLGLIAMHVLAAFTVCVIVWQTYDLSQRAVLSWAAWTSFYPFLWLFLGPVAHLAENGVDALDSHTHHSLKHTLGLMTGLLGQLQFLAGTAILASLTLVSGQNAVKVLAVYGCAAILMREGAVWTLQVLGLNPDQLD